MQKYLVSAGIAIVIHVIISGLSLEPWGSTFLLQERQTAVQEARPRHQRVDRPLLEQTGAAAGWHDDRRDPKTTTTT